MKTIIRLSTVCLLLLSFAHLLMGQESRFEATDFYNEEPSFSTDEIYTSSFFQRGNFMIGTGIGFSTARSSVEISGPSNFFDGDGGTSTQLNISPSIGYFFAKNFVFGLGMDYISNETSTPENFDSPNPTEVSSNNRDVLFGPFARLYFPVSDDKAFFLSTTVGFGSSRDEFISGSGIQSVDNNLFTAGIGPGFTIMATDGLALESIVKYNYARSESDIDVDGITRTTSTTTNAFDFSVGIRYYFGGLQSVNN